MNNKASFKITKAHWDIFVDYFQEHPELATGRINRINSKENHKKLWAELALQLNSLGLGVKPVEKWQKSWSDYKCSLKKKVGETSKVKNQTEAGPLVEKQFTETELNMLDVLGESFYENSRTIELGVEDGQIQENIQESSKRKEEVISDVEQEETTLIEPSYHYTTTDHDYFAPSPKPKKQKMDELNKMYGQTINTLESINKKLDGMNHAMNSIAYSLSIIAHKMGDK